MSCKGTPRCCGVSAIKRTTEDNNRTATPNSLMISFERRALMWADLGLAVGESAGAQRGS